MSSDFSTRCLKLNYKFSTQHVGNLDACNNALTDVLRRLFNTGYRISKSSCLIYTPTHSDYYKIVIALNSEFIKQPLLKGMTFRVDLWERMREV